MMSALWEQEVATRTPDVRVAFSLVSLLFKANINQNYCNDSFTSVVIISSTSIMSAGVINRYNLYNFIITL